MDITPQFEDLEIEDVLELEKDLLEKYLIKREQHIFNLENIVSATQRLLKVREIEKEHLESEIKVYKSYVNTKPETPKTPANGA